MTEIWKSIGVFKGIDFTGYYEASNLGRVKRLARKDVNGREVKELIYNPKPNKFGDLFIVVHYEGKNICGLVGQYVMSAFHPDHPPEKNRVRHIDGNKANNRLDNLEWASQKEICNYGTFTQKQAMTLKMKVEPVVQLDMENGNFIKEYRLREDIKISRPSTIVAAINKKKYYCNGYIWLYKSEYENMTHKEIMEIIKNVKQRHNERNEGKKKAVLQFDMDYNFVAEYKSITEAAKAVKCTKQAISLCLVDPQHYIACKGYIWRYKR